MAQALLGFLKNQYVELDGAEHRFFEGAWGIFGHGILAGFGQALQQNPDFPYYLCRNEQAAVHIATAFAKSRLRLSTFACISSIGTGYRRRTATGLDGDYVPVDFVALCAGLGAHAVRVRTREELEQALAEMRTHDTTTAVVIEVDKEQRVPGYESWWDVPVSEVSEIDSIRQARTAYEEAVKKERRHEIRTRS
jgi:TPP-dependent trihydroxycyclohexane-1,2-dione (THcHDO) dehydratase